MDCSDIWQISFYLDKYNVLHFGNHIPLSNNSMKDVQFKSVDKEKM